MLENTDQEILRIFHTVRLIECNVEENKDKLLVIPNYTPILEIKYFYIEPVLVTLRILVMESYIL